MNQLTLCDEHRLFGGQQQRWQHDSTRLHCTMKFSLFLPPQHAEKPVPLIWCLAGLTCDDQNFAIKSGAQKVAAQLGLALIMPDTSPRGAHIADHTEYDLGQGAGFYLDATQAPWSDHYQMLTYLSEELPNLVSKHFNVSQRQSILGHSMGGHGALMLALRQPERYHSVSAFAPIVNPMDVPWGQKAFHHYLGDNPTAWQAYDACQLMRQSPLAIPILIDQGDQDPFLHTQLQPQQLLLAEPAIQQLRWQPGYDHSYYFISSFIEDHLRFHHQHLHVQGD